LGLKLYLSKHTRSQLTAMLLNRLFITLLLLDESSIDVIASRGRQKSFKYGAHRVQVCTDVAVFFIKMFKFCETNAISNNSFIVGNS